MTTRTRSSRPAWRWSGSIIPGRMIQPPCPPTRHPTAVHRHRSQKGVWPGHL